jgi:hypothetical protein
LPDGSYTVSAYALDGAGQTSTTATFNFTIDHFAPTVSIDVPPNATTFSTSTPTFTFSDVAPPGTADSFACHIDSDPNVPCSPDFGIPPGGNLSDGPHTLTVTGQDRAGNLGQSTLDFVVDTMAPVVTIPGAPTNPSQFATSTPSLSFQVSNTPNTTPLAESVCAIYDAAPPNTLRASSTAGSICSSPFTPQSALSDGSYLFEVTATDGAGNVGRQSHAVVFTVSTQ